MSADRYEISECELDVLAITGPEGTRYIDGEDIEAKIIRQQARDIAELRAELQMCCELKREYQERAAVAAEQADQLRAELAAAVSENAALLAANRDLKVHFDALKGDYDEAAHFARHFIRDDAAITPRGAIIRLGDKCTSLFARMKIAETERDEWIACHAQLYRKLGNLLAVIHRDGGHYESEHGTEKACADAETAVHVMRGCVDGFISSATEWRQRAEQAEARLAAIDSAPTVAVIESLPNPNGLMCNYLMGVDVPASVAHGDQLIIRPAKDHP